jgi:hypothetical protein
MIRVILMVYKIVNAKNNLEERKVVALEQIADRLARLEELFQAMNRMLDDQDVFRR